MNTINKNTETLLKASREAGIEVNTQKTKYMVVSRHQNQAQNHNLLTIHKSFKMWQNSNIWEQETSSLTHRLRVSENTMPGEYFGPSGKKGRKAGEDCIMRSFIICTLHKFFRVI
jgi:hypothetical protein